MLETMLVLTEPNIDDPVHASEWLMRTAACYCDPDEDCTLCMNTRAVISPKDGFFKIAVYALGGEWHSDRTVDAIAAYVSELNPSQRERYEHLDALSDAAFQDDRCQVRKIPTGFATSIVVTPDGAWHRIIEDVLSEPTAEERMRFAEIIEQWPDCIAVFWHAWH